MYLGKPMAFSYAQKYTLHIPQEFNDKNTLGIMSMGTMKGDKLIFQAVGQDIKEARGMLKKLEIGY